MQAMAWMEDEWQLSDDETNVELLDEEVSYPTDYLQREQDKDDSDIFNEMEVSIYTPKSSTDPGRNNLPE